MPLARPSLPCFNECAIDSHHHSLSGFGDNTGVIDFPADLFFNAFADSERSVTCGGMILTAGFRQQRLQERSGLTVRKLRCEFGLQMPEFETYPLGHQVRYRRGHASF